MNSFARGFNIFRCLNASNYVIRKVSKTVVVNIDLRDNIVAIITGNYLLNTFCLLLIKSSSTTILNFIATHHIATDGAVNRICIKRLADKTFQIKWNWRCSQLLSCAYSGCFFFWAVVSDHLSESLVVFFFHSLYLFGFTSKSMNQKPHGRWFYWNIFTCTPFDN